MSRTTDTPTTRRRAVNLTMRADMIDLARELDLNLSKAAERGVIEAVRAAQEEKFLSENQGAIDAYNARIAREGLPIRAYWLDEK